MIGGDRARPSEDGGYEKGPGPEKTEPPQPGDRSPRRGRRDLPSDAYKALTCSGGAEREALVALKT